MNATQTTHWNAVVTVRVPRDGTDDLAASATDRLERSRDVEAVDLGGIRNLQPTLAATVVTVAVTVRTCGGLDAPALEQRLADAPGIQRVAEVGRP